MTEELCPFCKGTGVCMSVDLFLLPQGEMSLGEAIEKFGELSSCCEGCLPPKEVNND